MILKQLRMTRLSKRWIKLIIRPRKLVKLEIKLLQKTIKNDRKVVERPTQQRAQMKRRSRKQKCLISLKTRKK